MGNIRTDRAATFELLGNEVFDLAIVGGGITGASIARDAAMRGYQVVLLEAQDFAAGTSSRSSRLIHGGLRYLQHAEFGLVFESVSERALLSRLARHITRPLRFTFPIYRGDHHGVLVINVGMWIYDMLAMFRNYQRHRRLTAKQLHSEMPSLRAEGLRGAVSYYDYQTDDARLVLENVLGARNAGAVLLSRARVTAVTAAQPIKELVVEDALDGQAGSTVKARAIISATGPWTDRFLALTGKHRHWLRPTKGVHIVVPADKLRVDGAVAMQHPFDGRPVFVLPFDERTVVGTTDTDFDGDPARVSTTSDDVNYLMVVIDHYFPSSGVTTDDVISTWAGVRPLLAEDEDAGTTSAVSREHQITAREDGVVIIAGGKLTTYRRMAAECLEAALPIIAANGGPLPQPPAPTDVEPLPGAVGLATDEDFDALIARLGGTFPPAAARQLANSYGSRATQLQQLAIERPELAEPMVDELPYIWAQVVFSTREEMALTLEDVLIRRTRLFYRDRDQGMQIAPRVAQLMGEELGWDEAEQRRQLDRYLAAIAANRSWRAPDDASELIVGD